MPYLSSCRNHDPQKFLWTLLYQFCHPSLCRKIKRHVRSHMKSFLGLLALKKLWIHCNLRTHPSFNQNVKIFNCSQSCLSVPFPVSFLIYQQLASPIVCSTLPSSLYQVLEESSAWRSLPKIFFFTHQPPSTL